MKSQVLLLLLFASVTLAAVTVTTDSATYAVSGTVTYTVTPTNPDDIINISIKYPNNTIANEPSPLNTTVQNSSTYTLAPNAIAGTWTINVTDANTFETASTTFAVNRSYANPTVSLNSTSAAVTKGFYVNVSVNITQNINDIDNLTVRWDCAGTDCRVYNASGELANGTALQNLAAGSVSNLYLLAHTNESTAAGLHTITINATSALNSSYVGSNSLALTATEGSLALAPNNAAATDAYFVAAGQLLSFSVAFWNNYSAPSPDTFTINASASSGWAVNFSNGTAVGAINGTSGTHGLTLNNFSSGTLYFNVSVPASAVAGDSITITLNATSNANASHTTAKMITVKAPQFTSTFAIAINASSNIMSVSAGVVSREGTVLAQGDLGTYSYSIFGAANGTLMNSNSSLTTGATSTVNISTWPLSNYTVNVTIVDTSGRTKILSMTFKLNRALTLAVPSTSFVMYQGVSFTLQVRSRLDDSIQVVPSVSSYSGVCTYSSMSTDSDPYRQYVCTTPTVGSYNITVSNSVGDCYLSGTTIPCNFLPTLSNSQAVSLTVNANSTSVPYLITTPPGPGAGGNYSSNQSGSSNQSTGGNQSSGGASKPISISVANPTMELIELKNLSITVSNNGSTSMAVQVSIAEKGDWTHVELNHTAISQIAAGGSATINLSIAPVKWAKPGTYTVTLNISGTTKDLTITVPKPTDGKTVHRYLEVAKAGNSTAITLDVSNTKSEPQNITVLENIPKDVAETASDIRILSDYSYTVIDPDPIIQWAVNLGAGESAEIKYSVNKDVIDANFTEPNVTETSATAAGQGGASGTAIVGGGMDLFLPAVLAIVSVIVIVFSYAFFTGKVKLPKRIPRIHVEPYRPPEIQQPKPEVYNPPKEERQLPPRPPSEPLPERPGESAFERTKKLLRI